MQLLSDRCDVRLRDSETDFGLAGLFGDDVEVEGATSRAGHGEF